MQARCEHFDGVGLGQGDDARRRVRKAEKAVAFILEKLDKLDENIDKLDANSSKFDDKPFMERIDKLAAFYRKVYDKMKSLDIDDMQVEDTFVELRQKIQKLAGGYQPDLGPAIQATPEESAQEEDVYFSEEDNNFDFLRDLSSRESRFLSTDGTRCPRFQTSREKHIHSKLRLILPSFLFSKLSL